MANNKVIANSGSPFTAATDEIAGVDYGKTKLFSSEEDSTEGIGDDDKGTYRALWVAPRLRTSYLDMASAALTTGATPYSIGDTLGSGWLFPNAVDIAGGTGKIRGLRMIDKADLVTGVTLYFATAAITFGTDNVAPSVSDVDILKIIASATIGFQDLGGARIAALDSVVIPYACDATTLYIYATTNVAHNQFGAVTDLPLWMLIEKD